MNHSIGSLSNGLNDHLRSSYFKSYPNGINDFYYTILSLLDKLSLTCHQHCLMSEWIRPSKLRESGSFYSKSFKRINLIVLGPHILYEECQDGIKDRWFLFNIKNTQSLRSIWSNVSSKLLQGFWINTNENSFWKSRFKCAWHLIYNICRDLKKLNFLCVIGFRMKGSSSLRCAATGCWNPNELPQCIREDLYGKKAR